MAGRQPLCVASLFSGAGGLDLVFERALKKHPTWDAMACAYLIV
jgi:site-specific DNA-cytosine methylase